MTSKNSDKPQKAKAAADKAAKTAQEQTNAADIPANQDPTQEPSAAQEDDAMIDWEAAMKEQLGSQFQQTEQPATPQKQQATPAVFAPLVSAETVQSSLNIDALKDIPVQITVELGRTSMTVREVLQLGQGSVVELENLAGEPLDILINGHLIAQGEVVVVGENYGVRLTDISSVSDRMSRYTKVN